MVSVMCKVMCYGSNGLAYVSLRADPNADVD
jgi:hypothetical protein